LNPQATRLRGSSFDFRAVIPGYYPLAFSMGDAAGVRGRTLGVTALYKNF